LHFLDDGLRGRLQCQCFIRVLVVHVVPNAYELALLIAAAKENDRDTDDFAVGDARQIWRVGAELELVDTNGEWSD
jgi:hypothetical protein